MIKATMTSDTPKVSAMEQSVNPLPQHAKGEKLIDWLEFKYAANAGSQHVLVKELVSLNM